MIQEGYCCDGIINSKLGYKLRLQYCERNKNIHQAKKNCQFQEDHEMMWIIDRRWHEKAERILFSEKLLRVEWNGKIHSFEERDSLY